MPTAEVHSIAKTPITCHAFNADRTRTFSLSNYLSLIDVRTARPSSGFWTEVALSLNDNDVNIYAKHGKEWEVTDTLSEHDKTITSIDWAPRTNCIVTTSQDRNAYVWSQSPDPDTGAIVWKPTLVVLRMNRAATFVRWSPNEDKFAVGSGARMVAICSFDSENNWWFPKHLKKPIRSTVLCVDWHPNNVLLAVGSCDMKARVFSAYMKEVDTKPAPSVWGEKLPFHTVCGEYESPAGGWVHAIGFSPSGDALAFAGHDSSISIVYPKGPAIHTIRCPTLPYVTLTWTAEDAIVFAGHSCQPTVYSGSIAGWSLAGTLDDESGTSKSAKPATVGRLNSVAFNTFRNADTRGQMGDVVNDTELHTLHQNTITSVRPYTREPNGAVTKVSTSSVDGRLVVWNVSAVSSGGRRY